MRNLLIAGIICGCIGSANADVCHAKPGDDLQLATNGCAGGDLWLDPGEYTINVVSNKASVTLKSNLHCNGATIKFVGDALLRDWVGIFIAQRSAPLEITGCTFDGTGVTGVNEHSPLIQIRGPNDSDHINHNTFNYPGIEGFKRGDCIQSIGYPENSQMVTNLRVDHNTFQECARVGFAFHSGTVGEVDHNVFINGGRAADLDGEGSGFNTLKIHHNKVYAGLGNSVLALNIQADSYHEIYDNEFEKGINLYGCTNCTSHDNVVTFSVDSPVPVLTVTKNSPNYYDYDNKYVRTAGAKAGIVVQVAQRISAPSNVVLEDDNIVQYSSSNPVIQTLGIVGFTLRNSLMESYGAVPFTGWDIEGITSRVSNLVMDHVTWLGDYSPVVLITGSYGGAGSLTIVDSAALDALKSLVCINIAVGNQILGPITFRRNKMPQPIFCPMQILL